MEEGLTHRMPEARDVYRRAAHVGCVDGPTDSSEGTVCYVAPLPNGPILVLRDSAASVWAAASDGGTLEAIVDRVATGVGLDPAAIADDVAQFVSDLVRRGLLHTSAEGLGGV